MSNSGDRHPWFGTTSKLFWSPGLAWLPWSAALWEPCEVVQTSLSCLGGICRTLRLGQSRTVKGISQWKMDHMGPLVKKKKNRIQSSALPPTSPVDLVTAGQVISLFLFCEVRNTAFLCVEDYSSVMARHFSTLNLSSATSPLSRELVFKGTGRLCDPQKIMQQIRGLNPGTRRKSHTAAVQPLYHFFPGVSSFVLFWTVAGVYMGMPDNNTVDRKST